MPATRITRRADLAGHDWELGVEPGQTVRQGSRFEAGGITLHVTGGNGLNIAAFRASRQGPGRVAVNLASGERLIGTRFLDLDFSGAIRIGVEPAVAGVGIQFAAPSLRPTTHFDALLRVILETGGTDEVVDLELRDGVTRSAIDDSAPFLGALASAGTLVKAMLIDVRPRPGSGTPEVVLVNRFRIQP